MANSVQYFCLNPAYFRLDGGAMYGIIPKPLWQKHSLPDELNRIDLSLRLWLIKTSKQLILIDTGIGDYHDETFNQRFDIRGDQSPLVESLHDLGFKASDVTDIIISHLHFDHVGGLGRKQGAEFVPIFPQATLHLHRQHYDYACKPTARDSGSFQHKYFLPLIDYYQQKNQLNWQQGEEGVLFSLDEDGPLRFCTSHGHTPWLMHPYNDRFIYCADLIPTSHHLPIPWVMGYDIAPGQTTVDKQLFLERACQKGLTLIFEHDIDHWGGKIEVCPKQGFKLKQAYPCSRQRAIELTAAR